MKPVCVPCRRFFRAKKNGFAFIEGMPTKEDAQPGHAELESWKPYKLWLGDLYECLGCGAQIVSGFGKEPVSEHYEPSFQRLVEQLSADQLQVNDC